MIIDAHMHVGLTQEAEELAQSFAATNGYSETLLPDGRVDRQAFLKLLEASGIDIAVIIGNRLVGNEYVLEFCANEPCLLPFIVINPSTLVDPEKELRTWFDKGAKGLKMFPTYHHYYPNDAALYPVYKVAEELGLPITYHTGSSTFRNTRIKYGQPLLLDDVAVSFPQLNLLMAHCGRGFWYEEAAFLARLHPNIYLELSGLPPYKLLSYLPNLEALADKAVFGTDWPACPSISNNIQELQSLPLSFGALEKILYGNMAKILKLSTIESKQKCNSDVS